MIHYRKVFESLLPKKDAYLCALWAFGEGFEELTIELLPERWNELHSDIFKLDMYGDLETDIPKIIESWEKPRHHSDTGRFEKR